MLSKLHSIFQAAMGWQDCYLHCFEIGDLRYGNADPDFELDDIDEDTVVMADVVGERARFDYEYDFGDSWSHEVVVESVTTLPVVLKYAVCLDGQRACPPEDVRGIDTYERVLQAIRDPRHEEHNEYTDWLPPGFDPEAFNLAATNAALQRVR